MDPERFNRLSSIFADARDLPREQRDEFLTRACGGDSALRAEVEDLLVADAEDDVDAVGDALAEDAVVGRRKVGRPETIGRYRVLGVCGSGGMGTVYEAEQDAPPRRVALKVMQGSALGPELLSRFRREAAILARLQHPFIAQIFEAGEFEQDGVERPYFAMEFVDGCSLIAHGEQRKLSRAARVELFIRICEAISYAHSQGVVHRDLKPDNIFVVDAIESGATMTSGVSQPKVLDFGVARLTDSDRQLTMATGAGQLLGSVAYMSPEQADGDLDQVGDRSDLYSLGIVLFELLVGELPYSVRDLALADALHIIRHGEPRKLGSVDAALRGDLETIVGKCIEKDPQRRYESVAALIEDLRRYQSHEPITARPPSNWYQLKKFARRNRALVVGAALAVVSLIIGAVVSIAFGVRANRDAAVAVQNQMRSEREAYRANIGAASALLSDDPGHARRILDGIPDRQRGWEWRYLSAALSGLQLEFGHVLRRQRNRMALAAPEQMSVFALAEGQRVVVLESGQRFAIWDPWTGRQLRSIEAPGPVEIFAAAKDGSALAAGLEDGRVVVADLREGATTTWSVWVEQPDDDVEIWALAVAPSGDRIAVQTPTEIRFGRPGSWLVGEDSSYWLKKVGWRATDLEFRSDGQQLAALMPDLRVWETVSSGALVQAGIASTQEHTCIAFEPDGGRIASGQYRRELRVYGSLSGELEHEFFGHSHDVTHVAYGSTNDRVLTVSYDDGSIRVWDLGRGEQVGILDAPHTTAAEFLDDDHVLSLTDGRLRLWELSSLRARTLRGHQGRPFEVVFSGEGDLLATVAPWSNTILWDPLEPEPVLEFVSNHRRYLSFDRAGERLLRSYYRNGRETSLLSGGVTTVRATYGASVQFVPPSRLRVDGADVNLSIKGPWTRFRVEHAGDAGGSPVRLPPRAWLNGQELEVQAAAADFVRGPHPILWVGGPSKQRQPAKMAELIVFHGALSAEDGAVMDEYLAGRLSGTSTELPSWESDAELVVHFRADAATVECDEEGAVLGWVATNDSSRRLVADGAYRSSIRLVAGHAGAPAHLHFGAGWGISRHLEMALPDVRGDRPLTVCWLGDPTRATSQNVAYSIASFPMPFAGQRDERIWKLGSENAFSPDGRWLVSDIRGDEVGRIVVRDGQTGYVVGYLDGEYRGVSFDASSRRLACGREDGSIDVFDVATFERVDRIAGAHSSACYDVAFSPDGTRLASAGNDNALRIWDAETLEFLLELPGHRSYVRGVAWSADSTMLASVSGDKLVRIWDSVPSTDRYQQRLTGRALADEVRDRVETIHRDYPDPDAAFAAVRRRWPDDRGRRMAALKVLARLRRL